MMANESEKESMREAASSVSGELKSLIDLHDLENLKQLQHLIVGRLQDSNAVLTHFNDYSEHSFAEVSADFSRNTRLLKSMKTDLDYIFQKLRNMKSKLVSIYPDAFADDMDGEVVDRRPDLDLSQ